MRNLRQVVEAPSFHPSPLCHALSIYKRAQWTDGFAAKLKFLLYSHGDSHIKRRLGTFTPKIVLIFFTLFRDM